MTFQYLDRLKEVAGSSGTADFTMPGTGAVGYRPMSTIGNGNTHPYFAWDYGANWEVGLGTYASSGGILARTTIYSSSNAGAAVNFPTAPTVFGDVPATLLIGGSDTHVQFNDGGKAGGSSAMTFNKTTGVASFAPGAATTLGGHILNFNSLATASLPVLPHANSMRIALPDGVAGGFYMHAHGTTGNYPVIVSYSAGGTMAVPLKTIADQELLRISGRGYQETTAAYTGSNAAISFQAVENYTSTSQGSWIGFRTVAIGAAGQGNAFSPPTNAAVTPSGGLLVGPSFFTAHDSLYTTLNREPGAGYVQAQAGFMVTGATIADTVALVGTGFTGTYSIKVAPNGFAPSADGATAFQIFKADGTTAVVTLNTTTSAATFAGTILSAGNLTLTATNAALGVRNSGTVWTSPANGTWQSGAADVDTGPVAQTLRSQGALAGGTSNVAGANLTIIASPGKGTGAGGSIIFQTAPAGSTGTAVNAPVTALTISSTGVNISLPETVSAAGAASVAASLWSGAIYAAGTGTTNLPAMLAQPTGAVAVTTWSTAGTVFGVNAPSAFAGNFIDFHVNGGVSVFGVSNSGFISTSSGISANRLNLSVARSASAWTTNGLILINSSAVFTDTTSSGAVAASYINAFKAPTFASTSSVTLAQAFNAYFETPVNGTNTTITAAYALGADTAYIATIAMTSTGLTFQPSQGITAIGSITTNNANGYQLKSGGSTATNATVITNRSANTTGWGGASGNISAVLAGAESARFSPAGFSGQSAAPSIAAGLGAGTSPTIAIAGSAIAGLITLTTGTAPSASATVATVTYAASFDNGSFVVLTAANALTAALSGTSMVFAVGGISNFVMTSGAVPLASATQYIWNYHVIGN